MSRKDLDQLDPRVSRGPEYPNPNHFASKIKAQTDEFNGLGRNLEFACRVRAFREQRQNHQTYGLVSDAGE
jgi:hypothetical protein